MVHIRSLKNIFILRNCARERDMENISAWWRETAKKLTWWRDERPRLGGHQTSSKFGGLCNEKYVAEIHNWNMEISGKNEISKFDPSRWVIYS